MTLNRRSKVQNGGTPSKKLPGSSVWTIEILDRALDQIAKFDPAVQARIFKFLARLPQFPHPRSTGEALVGSWAGYWKYRIGDYRLVCQIVDRRLVVVVVKAGNRREIYR